MGQKLIVTVCRDNIARSPFSEAVIKKELARQGLNDKYRVISRGVQGTPVDPEPVKFSNITYYHAMYQDAKPVLDELGIDLSAHVSTRIDDDTAKRASIILALDTKTLRALQALFPEQTGKVVLLSELVHESRDIVDPEGLRGATKQRHVFSDLHNIIVTGFPRLLHLVEQSESGSATKTT